LLQRPLITLEDGITKLLDAGLFDLNK